MNYEFLKSKHAKLHISAKEDIVLQYLYEKVIGYQINNVNDVVRLAVLSYGWMPTMNKGKFIDNDIELSLIKDYLVEIQKSKSRQKAINIAFQKTKASDDFLRLTNNSVVGLSKALHIIRPDVFPIIDSHMLNGLREYGKHIGYPKDKIPKSKYPTHELDFFENFTRFLSEKLPDVPVREVEKILFDLGRSGSSRKVISSKK